MRNHAPSVFIAGLEILGAPNVDSDDGPSLVLRRRASRFIRGLNDDGFFTVLFADAPLASSVVQIDRTLRQLQDDLRRSAAQIDAVVPMSGETVTAWTGRFVCTVAAKYRIDSLRSFLVADRPSVIAAARSVGLTTIAVGGASARSTALRSDYVVADLDAALTVIRGGAAHVAIS